MQQIFIVDGMSCGHCEKAVTQAVLQIDPRAEVRIDRPNRTVAVQSDQPRDTLAQAIVDEGYSVEPV